MKPADIQPFWNYVATNFFQTQADFLLESRVKEL
jgi:hypothetical protein